MSPRLLTPPLHSALRAACSPYGGTNYGAHQAKAPRATTPCLSNVETMQSIARVIVDHSRRVLAVTALITIAAALMLFRMDFNADVASFVLEGNETGETFQALQDKYATADPINVVASLPDGEKFTSVDNTARLVRLRDSLSSVPGVDRVVSAVPEVNPLTGKPLTTSLLAASVENVDAFRALNPFADILLSEDRAATMLMVVPSEDSLGVAQDVSDIAPPNGIELTFSGNPVVFSSVIDILSFFLLLIPPAVFILLGRCLLRNDR